MLIFLRVWGKKQMQSQKNRGRHAQKNIKQTDRETIKGKQKERGTKDGNRIKREEKAKS